MKTLKQQLKNDFFPEQVENILKNTKKWLEQKRQIYVKAIEGKEKPFYRIQGKIDLLTELLEELK